jgi:hypothetical protein
MVAKMTVVKRSANTLGVGSKDRSEGAMSLHKFVKANSWRGALTPDRSGANLPQGWQPWIYEKNIHLALGDSRRTGASSAEMIKAVLERGYFLLPVSDDV